MLLRPASVTALSFCSASFLFVGAAAETLQVQKVFEYLRPGGWSLMVTVTMQRGEQCCFGHQRFACCKHTPSVCTEDELFNLESASHFFSFQDS